MEIYKKQTLSETFSVYFDKRMIRILLLGIISGFPWVLIGSSLSLWLKEDGLSRSAIGWAGLIFAVYAFNYLWAPIIDRIRIPWLTKKIGPSGKFKDLSDISKWILSFGMLLGRLEMIAVLVLFVPKFWKN